MGSLFSSEVRGRRAGAATQQGDRSQDDDQQGRKVESDRFKLVDRNKQEGLQRHRRGNNPQEDAPLPVQAPAP